MSNVHDAVLELQAKKRNELRRQTPGICAWIFENLMNVIISEVIGWDDEKSCYNGKGLFGNVKAYSLSVEEQGRKTLHAYFLIWVPELQTDWKQFNSTDLELRREAKQSIQCQIDKLASSTIFFSNCTRKQKCDRKKVMFQHDCNGKQEFGTHVQFPDDEFIRALRNSKGFYHIKKTVAKCDTCLKTWTIEDIVSLYAKRY